MHEYLIAAMAVQDARRDWIITNWPRLIELEQVTQIINAQRPLAHWPTVRSDEVREMLEQLRQLAPHLDVREERTLADLDRQEVDNDPVLRLEARRGHLRQLAARAASRADHDGIDTELASLNGELRTARREQLHQQAFDRYLPTPSDEARAAQMTILAHDTFTNQPRWVIEHLECLHDNDQLTTCDAPGLASRITSAAAALEQHGRLPKHWPTPQTIAHQVPEPTLGLG